MACRHQIAADIAVDSLYERLRTLRDAWIHDVPLDHPTRRALAAADKPHRRPRSDAVWNPVWTTWTPGTPCFRSASRSAAASRANPWRAGSSAAGWGPATTQQLVSLYRRSRKLPASCIPTKIVSGVFVTGFVTADVLTGTRGLLNHIYRRGDPPPDVGRWVLAPTPRTARGSLFHQSGAAVDHVRQSVRVRAVGRVGRLSTEAAGARDAAQPRVGAGPR